MTVLGVLVTVHHDTVVLTIEKARLTFWSSELLALRSSSGIRARDLARRMAGRLEFAAGAAWGPAARA
eukprot:6911921-Heterocapsa_arctica.AAC.1